jgi:hypothetical protein
MRWFLSLGNPLISDELDNQWVAQVMLGNLYIEDRLKKKVSGKEVSDKWKKLTSGWKNLLICSRG